MEVTAPTIGGWLNRRATRAFPRKAEAVLTVLERDRRTFAWKTGGLDRGGLAAATAVSPAAAADLRRAGPVPVDLRRFGDGFPGGPAGHSGMR